MSVPDPFDRGQRIVEFADSVIVAALATLGATKVEPERRNPRPHERARERMCDLVVHCPAVLGVRMQNDSNAADRGIAGRLVDSLELAGRAGDCDRLGTRQIVHI